MKLDRLLAKHDSLGRTKARALIVAGRVHVDGRPIRRVDHEVDRFSAVELDGIPLRPSERRLHLMLHKPVGILSATSDPVHRTVIDLIDDPDRHTLHLVGRLDRNTSGLILLTNDGNWSKPLMAPETKVPKIYLVETRDPIPSSAIEAFAAGFHFPTEDLTTLPAALEILAERRARLTLHEGRYHQIKRMFHRIGNRVAKLHRESIGTIHLPPDLGPGQWRILTEEEIGRVMDKTPSTRSAFLSAPLQDGDCLRKQDFSANKHPKADENPSPPQRMNPPTPEGRVGSPRSPAAAPPKNRAAPAKEPPDPRLTTTWKSNQRRKASCRPPSTVMTWPVVLLRRPVTSRK